MKIIVGDIHACRQELDDLLELVGFGPEDEVIALGDIFDRGPDNRSILKLFTEDPRFKSLLGNHERKHILWEKGKIEPAISQRITKEEVGEDYPKLLEFVKTLPLYIELEEAVLVHGGMEPGIDLDKQAENVVVGSISGERHLDKLEKAWYELLDLKKPVIFGHRAFQKPFNFENKAYGIDTGCCRGNYLTALTLPDFKIYQVKAKSQYWPKARQDFLDLHPELIKKKKNETLEDLGVDVEKTYLNIIDYAAQLKQETNSRKEFAKAIQLRGQTYLLFKAYDDRLKLEDIIHLDIKTLKYFVEYKK